VDQLYQSKKDSGLSDLAEAAICQERAVSSPTNSQLSKGSGGGPLEKLNFDDMQLKLTTPEVTRIFLKFKPLFINRVRRHATATTTVSECTFKPDLRQSSQSLEKLLPKRSENYPSPPVRRQRKPPPAPHEERLLQECTFHPKVGGGKKKLMYHNKFQELYARAKRRQVARDKTTEEVEYERALKECTFKPLTTHGASGFSKRQLDQPPSLRLSMGSAAAL
jgi:hypothetical protein